MAPFFSLVRNPWIGIIIFVVIVVGSQQLRVVGAQYKAASCEREMFQQAATFRQAQAEGQEAARRAVEAAVSHEREQAASRVRAEQEAAERLREAAKAAQREADEWRTRFRTARESDPSCQEWSEQPVACPL